MQFSDTTNKLGIVQMIDDLCSTNSTSFPIEDKTRIINVAYDTIFIEQVLQAGSRQVDDTNYTILPQKTLSFSSGDRQITLPDDLVFVDHLEITDKSGNYYTLTRTDKTSREKEWQSGREGQPKEFDEQGEMITFDTTLDYSGTIRLWYTRNVELFADTDTTKTPGIQRVLHSYLAYYTSIEYCNKHHPERVALMEKRLGQLENTARRLTGKAKRRVTPWTASRNSSK